MESSSLIAVLLPLVLGVIMLGLGLSLTVADFTRVVKMPRAVLIGLGCQMLILPAVCFGVVTVAGLPPELAVGMMLLAASPGGATANLFSHLARGDVALNISLTAVNSLLSVVTVPLIVNLSSNHFLADDRAIPLQLAKTAQIFAVVLVPVAIGMVVRRNRPSAADKMSKPVRILSAAFLLLVVIAAILKERAHIGEYFQQVGLAALAFNLASLGVGYGVPRLFRLGPPQAVAIGMEVGIHNGTLAIAIASSPLMLNNSVMAIPPAVYSVIMFFTAAAFAFAISRRLPAAAPAA
jgi:bile acid:Na+ symporter, BASS family